LPDAHSNTLLSFLEHNGQSASKVSLAPEDRKQEMKELEKDILYHSPIDDKLEMNRGDEKVLEGYKSEGTISYSR